MSERCRSSRNKPLPRFVRQTINAFVVDVFRQTQGLLLSLLRNLPLLTFDVPRILGLYIELQRYLLALLVVGQRTQITAANPVHGGDLTVVEFRPFQQHRRRRIGCSDKDTLKTRALLLNRLILCVVNRPTLIINQPKLATNRRQPQVSIVFAQSKAILSATRKHAVGLAYASRDEIVDQHADIGFMALWEPALFILRLPRRVDASKQALRARFFISCCAVDLPRKIQTTYVFCLKRRLKIAGIEIVVFDRVTRLCNFCAFKTRDRAYELDLNLIWQAGRNAVRVYNTCRQAFWLDKYLVRDLICEANNLIFDRRAVTRADAFYHTAVHW